MRNYLAMGLLALACTAFGESTLPEGCKPLKVQGESATIEAKKPLLVFIHNITSGDLWITHPVSDPGASAGWSSRLQADNWSAIVVDKGPFALNCIESRPGHEQQIPCEAALAVCKWERPKLASDGKGDYWVGEDMSLNGLIAAVGAKGFSLAI